MATPYSKIYSRFMSKITNYSFVDLDIEELEDQLQTYLEPSIVKFRYCKKNLSNRDNNALQFNELLTDEEQEILAILMCVEYLTPKLLTDELLQQTLSSRDYKIYSQANHIKEIKALREVFNDESREAMILYTYTKNKMDEFL